MVGWIDGCIKLNARLGILNSFSMASCSWAKMQVVMFGVKMVQSKRLISSFVEIPSCLAFNILRRFWVNEFTTR